MTPRERFHAAMEFRVPDRVPLLEDSFQEGVIDRWRSEGLVPGADPAEIFGLARREDIPVDWAPRPALKSGLLTPRGLEELARGLDPEAADRLPYDWAKRCAAWNTREHILGLSVHDGLMLSMGIGDWAGFEEVMDILASDPVFARELMRIRGDFLARYAERMLGDVTPDFALVSEPIAGSGGSVVSPRMYREIALASYRPLIEVLRRGGVGTIVLMTWANSRVLMPAAVEAGFNALWACEAGPGAMDYGGIRREFGRRLGLIGGIDLDAVLAGDDAAEAEIASKVPPLIQGGGYIPLADGRIRANVPYPRYAFYRKVLARCASQ